MINDPRILHNTYLAERTRPPGDKMSVGRGNNKTRPIDDGKINDDEKSPTDDYNARASRPMSCTR